MTSKTFDSNLLWLSCATSCQYYFDQVLATFQIFCFVVKLSGFQFKYHCINLDLLSPNGVGEHETVFNDELLLNSCAMIAALIVTTNTVPD